MATKKTTEKVEKTVKAEAVKTETAKVEAVKADTKADAKAVKATKETKKATEPAKRTSCKTEVVFQFAGKEIAETDVIAKVKDALKGDAKKMPSMKTLKVYVKPEENAVYYVVNDAETGKVSLF